MDGKCFSFPNKLGTIEACRCASREFSNNEPGISECDYWQNGIQPEETSAASRSGVASTRTCSQNPFQPRPRVESQKKPAPASATRRRSSTAWSLRTSNNGRHGHFVPDNTGPGDTPEARLPFGTNGDDGAVRIRGPAGQAAAASPSSVQLTWSRGRNRPGTGLISDPDTTKQISNGNNIFRQREFTLKQSKFSPSDSHCSRLS